MNLTGEYRIPAPRERVWAMLNDPEILRRCLPGCEELTGDAGQGFSARVTTKIGPVKATFNGSVALSNLNPPESYTISGEGKGGVAGFAKGSADVTLAGDDAETVLTYEANAQVGGKLAQLGSRLIDSTAKKLANEFFSAFAAHASSASAAGAGLTMDAAVAPLASTPGRREGGAAFHADRSEPASAARTGPATSRWGRLLVIAAAIVSAAAVIYLAAS